MVKENVEDMTDFYYKNKLVNKRRSVELKKKQVYDQVLSAERKFLREAADTDLPEGSILIICIG